MTLSPSVRSVRNGSSPCNSFQFISTDFNSFQILGQEKALVRGDLDDIVLGDTLLASDVPLHVGADRKGLLIIQDLRVLSEGRNDSKDSKDS